MRLQVVSWTFISRVSLGLVVCMSMGWPRSLLAQAASNSDEALPAAEAATALEAGKLPDAMPLVGSDSAPTPTRVSSCAVHFPLDSVRFDESLVAHCFTDVRPERISYIHVIATASPDGTSTHNLYLSTRRAGAIEGYLRNRFPDVEIHAFGGGANPKFGKMARIFVVEAAVGATDAAGPTPVVDTTLPAPKVQAEIRYLEPKKFGASISAASGYAMYNSDSSPYQYAAFNGSYRFERGWLSRFELGMRYAIHRSNARLDVHTQHVYANKTWQWRTIRGIKTEYGARLFGGMAASNDVAVDAGTSISLGARAFDLAGALELGVTRHFRWLGVSVGTYI
jgi:outer membrane protein OmpA-like peptidoglycan-associated protein